MQAPCLLPRRAATARPSLLRSHRPAISGGHYMQAGRVLEDWAILGWNETGLKVCVHGITAFLQRLLRRPRGGEQACQAAVRACIPAAGRGAAVAAAAVAGIVSSGWDGPAAWLLPAVLPGHQAPARMGKGQRCKRLPEHSHQCHASPSGSRSPRPTWPRPAPEAERGPRHHRRPRPLHRRCCSDTRLCCRSSRLL